MAVRYRAESLRFTRVLALKVLPQSSTCQTHSGQIIKGELAMQWTTGNAPHRAQWRRRTGVCLSAPAGPRGGKHSSFRVEVRLLTLFYNDKLSRFYIASCLKPIQVHTRSEAASIELNLVVACILLPIHQFSHSLTQNAVDDQCHTTA